MACCTAADVRPFRCKRRGTTRATGDRRTRRAIWTGCGGGGRRGRPRGPPDPHGFTAGAEPFAAVELELHHRGDRDVCPASQIRCRAKALIEDFLVTVDSDPNGA